MEYRSYTRFLDMYPTVYWYPTRYILYSRYIYSLLQCHTYLSGSILWIPVPVCPLQCSLPCIHHSIYPSIQRYIPWVLFICIQCNMDRNSCVYNINGYSLHGLCTSLGTNELLGSNRHYKPIIQCPRAGVLAGWWLLHIRPHCIQVLYHTFHSTRICNWVPGIPCIISS